MQETEEDWYYISDDWDLSDVFSIEDLVNEGCINLSKKQYRDLMIEEN